MIKKIIKGSLMVIGGFVVLLFLLVGIVSCDVDDTDTTAQNTETKIETPTEKEEIKKTENEIPLGHKNAVKKAKSYLSLMGMSAEGLRKQLEFERFTKEEAKYGVENCEADWFKEAVEKAESYLSLTSMSREGLYRQLEFDGFKPEEIEYALTEIGY